MITILRLAFSLLLITAFTGCSSKLTSESIDKSNYIVKFGIFEHDSYTFHEETTTIPMKYDDTGFACGYCIYSKDKTDFVEYSITYPPIPHADGKKHSGLRGPTAKSFNGNVARKFGFDKGDPTGIWNTDFYVNGQLLTSISFEVTQPI